MWMRSVKVLQFLLFAGILFAMVPAFLAQTQSVPDEPKPAVPAPSPSAPGSKSRYKPNHPAKRATEYYSLIWGVDSLSLKWTESGEVIRFSYRVLDADKAKELNDKKHDPVLIDPAVGVKLVVPSLEKVGQLRQSATPEAGKSY